VRRTSASLLLACAALLAPVTPVGCAGVRRDLVEPSARVAPAPTPPFWRAHAQGYGELYLLGSVHIGTAGAADFDASIEQAFAQASELVVEVDVSRVTQAEILSNTQRYATLPPHLRLDALLSDDTREALADYVRSRGLPNDQVQALKPWFVSQLILMVELQAAGYDASLGVDRAFVDEANGSKPVVGLETIASQLAMLDGLSPELQELMLKDTLLRVDDLESHTQELLEAWSHGDDADLEHRIFESLDDIPELADFYEAVFWRRNAEMTARLVELARDGRSRFVVLGAGHLVGARGIPARLAEQGFVVERLAARAVPAQPEAIAPPPR
jgi:hypothetical protein